MDSFLVNLEDLNSNITWTACSLITPAFTLRLRACWQWCANGCNNFEQVWDLQCIVGRMQPLSPCNLCVMSVREPSNVGRAVLTDPTLLRYASAITEQKKCWELLAEKFDRFQTLRRVCKRTQHVTSNNVGSCWPTMLLQFARGFRCLKLRLSLIALN